MSDGNVWILDTVMNDFAGITRFYAGLMHEIKVLEGEAFLEYALVVIEIKHVIDEHQYHRHPSQIVNPMPSHFVTSSITWPTRLSKISILTNAI